MATMTYTPFTKRAWHFRARRITLHDNDRCDICGSDRCLHIRHINGNRKDNDTDNLAVLCKDHHLELHQL